MNAVNCHILKLQYFGDICGGKTRCIYLCIENNLTFALWVTVWTVFDAQDEISLNSYWKLQQLSALQQFSCQFMRIYLRSFANILRTKLIDIVSLCVMEAMIIMRGCGVMCVCLSPKDIILLFLILEQNHRPCHWNKITDLGIQSLTLTLQQITDLNTLTVT